MHDPSFRRGGPHEADTVGSPQDARPSELQATYRLQLTPDFRFGDAAGLAPYLAALGVSHVYASPVFAASAGSTHGYDVVDHGRLNPELGSAEDFEAMARAFRANGLGLILDIVPNHMGVVGDANAYWQDVLEWGPRSRFASWFDIDWNAPHPGLAGKVLMPVLGESYGAALAAGALVLRFDADEGRFAVWAHDTHKLPVSPLDYAAVLKAGELDAQAEAAAAVKGPEDPRWRDLRSDARRRTRWRGSSQRSPAAREISPPGPLLDGLILRQNWRPAKFSLETDALNYRRFFTISALAGVRVEDPDVFEATHGLVLSLAESGRVDGLRIDHIDGLRDPKGYLTRLRARTQEPFTLLVEKILGPGETLPADWPVEGTTGYEVTNLLAGLLIDPAADDALTRNYVEFTGRTASFDLVEHEAKRSIMTRAMAAELESLSAAFVDLASRSSLFRDLGLATMRAGLVEVVAGFDVYRTYADADGMRAEDRARVLAAVERARSVGTGLDPDVFDFIAAVLTLDLPGADELVMRVQQFTGPVMAKGVEDTAFYRYNRLIALNEVGGRPGTFSVPIDAFHAANAARQADAPRTMLTTSTHDTKRGEDARARIAAISAHPDDWRAKVGEWHDLLADPAQPIDRNEEYFLYQLLLGAWPMEWRSTPPREALDGLAGRVQAAMLKSVREAGVNTRWTFGNPDYEAALAAFIARAFAADSAFLRSFRSFEAEVVGDGVANSLIQTALKLTIPGVPDIYQGADLWDQSLVDPDNRRPIDFAHRRAVLEAEKAAAGPTDPMTKLALTSRLLRLRQAHPTLFREGSYEPLRAEGPGAGSVCAFLRRRNGEALLVAVALRHSGPAFTSATRIVLPGNDTTWHDVVADAARTSLSCLELFAESPVAVLRMASGRDGEAV